MILHPTYIVHFVMIFVRKTDKIFRQDKILSYCERLVRFPDKKNTHYCEKIFSFKTSKIFLCALEAFQRRAEGLQVVGEAYVPDCVG